MEDRRCVTRGLKGEVFLPVNNLTTPFNQERHLVSRETYKARRVAALVAWRAVMG